MDERIEYGYYDGMELDDTDDQNEECKDLAEGHQSTEYA